MTTILGLSAFLHDAAAALVCDGEILAAAEEERYSRKKHDHRFPWRAINAVLEHAFIEVDDIDAVVFYDHPILSLDRALTSVLAGAPGSACHMPRIVTSLLGAKLRVKDSIQRALRADVPVFFTDHHLAHAASAFYPSPFERAAILTIDGVGEWTTTSLGSGDGTRIELREAVEYPHSLGLLYSAFTGFCGFKVNSGEYKLMGLAPYGSPRFAARIREHLIDIASDGSYRLNLDYFGFLSSTSMTNERFDALFEGPSRLAESRITAREADLAASVQAVFEEVVVSMASHLQKTTGLNNLVLAGGAALNCTANGRLAREGIFDDIWIQPAAGDSGGALGAALALSHQRLNHPRQHVAFLHDGQKGSYLGTSYSSREVRAFLDRNDYAYVHLPEADERVDVVAKALADGLVVGWFSGRMEFGPRALGARSILADARRPDTQSVLNLKIKNRESFRPLAPSVLAERATDYFDLQGKSPYMLLVAPVLSNRHAGSVDRSDHGDDLIAIVNEVRSDIPAVTHVDFSARVQTVDAEQSPLYHMLISRFHALTGCAVVVNTSFNERGAPIVCTPREAFDCFMRTGIDVLVLEDCVLFKNDQSDDARRAAWATAPTELD